MTTSRIGRGALVTLGAAASMAWAAGAANACDNPKPPAPKPPAPTNTNPDHACTVDNSDVEYAVSDQSGNAVGGWHSTKAFYRTSDEPAYGYVVRLNADTVAKGCVGSLDVSLASYDTDAAVWEQTGLQTFVDFSTATLSTASKDSATTHLTVKLPDSAGGKCYGQIDLYPGNGKYDGHDKTHPLPNHSKNVDTPPGVWSAWNGSDTAGTCATAPTPPSSSSSPSSPGTTPSTTPSTSASTSPSSQPSSSASIPPAPPVPSSSTGATTTAPSTPATTTSPGAPTLAHTGANVGEVSLVALAFFGAGGTVMFASRKAKAVGARRH